MPVLIKNEEYLTDKEAANMLNMTHLALGQWRVRKKPYIPWLKLGRKVYYKESDVLDFIEKGKDKSNNDNSRKD